MVRINRQLTRLILLIVLLAAPSAASAYSLKITSNGSQIRWAHNAISLRYDPKLEMVLDRALAGPRDEQESLHARAGQFLDHVLDHGFPPHRQHFLGLGLGRGQQARARSRHGDDGDGDVHMFPVKSVLASSSHPPAKGLLAQKA